MIKQLNSEITQLKIMGFSRWVCVFLYLQFFLAKPLIADNFFTTNDLEEIPKYFLNRAQRPEMFEWMVSIKRKLHENPEFECEEFETSRFVREELDKLGISYKYPLAVNGVLGFIGSGKSPFVALRADMGALPIQELVEWEYRSKVPGKMHACGHDAHVAMLLGAARILQENRHKLQGTVVLVFQPGEKGYGGAKKMIEAGALENVEAIFALHVNFDLPVGQVSSRSGPLLAGSGFFQAVINGKGGHAAMPHHTVDPILAASNVIVSLQHIISREVNPLDFQIVTVGKFQGGGAFNVIPDSVTIGGTFQALLKESLLRLKQRIEEVIKSQAAVQRCTAKIEFYDGENFYPPTVNDEKLHEFFRGVATDMLGSHNMKEAMPLTRSEDFALYQEVIPGHFFFIGSKNETCGKTESEYNPKFMVDKDAFPYGASLYASVAARYLLEKGAKTPSQESIHHVEL